MFSPRRARVVDGHIVRNNNGSNDTINSTVTSTTSFSFRRFLFVISIISIMVITNPSNDEIFQSSDFYNTIVNNIQRQIHGKSRRTRRTTTNTYTSPSSSSTFSSDWEWQKILDPPLSITNYGIFTIEERNTKVSILGLTKSWDCNFFDNRRGAFCNAIVKNLCHEKPLLYDPSSMAFTAHRCICFLLIGVAFLSFCYCGQLPTTITSEPILRAILTSICRCGGRHGQVSLFSLAIDLFNASAFVYPALVRMERVVPTLKEGSIATTLGLPLYCDYIFYVVVLVLFLGGGGNALANFIFSKEPCFGFDSTVAAAVAYCHAFPSIYQGVLFSGGGAFDPSPTSPAILSPQTVFWGYLPVTALLGGSPSHALSWILAGMFGVMLGQYHLDNQNWFLAVRQIFQSVF